MSNLLTLAVVQPTTLPTIIKDKKLSPNFKQWLERLLESDTLKYSHIIKLKSLLHGWNTTNLDADDRTFINEVLYGRIEELDGFKIDDALTEKGLGYLHKVLFKKPTTNNHYAFNRRNTKTVRHVSDAFCNAVRDFKEFRFEEFYLNDFQCRSYTPVWTIITKQGHRYSYYMTVDLEIREY